MRVHSQASSATSNKYRIKISRRGARLQNAPSTPNPGRVGLADTRPLPGEFGSVTVRCTITVSYSQPRFLSAPEIQVASSSPADLASASVCHFVLRVLYSSTSSTSLSVGPRHCNVTVYSYAAGLHVEHVPAMRPSFLTVDAKCRGSSKSITFRILVQHKLLYQNRKIEQLEMHNTNTERIKKSHSVKGKRGKKR